MKGSDIAERLNATNLTQVALAEHLGLSPPAVHRMIHGRRKISVDEAEAINHFFSMPGGKALDEKEVEEFVAQHLGSYLKIRVLPAYAGMGGGGIPDYGDEHALFPRALIEDQLAAKASDLIKIDARGDSMAPTLLHGDQLLVDQRETSPTQPGIFALWDGDGYVVKRVQKVPRSDPPALRLSSDNDHYMSDEPLAEQVRILGRVVWFGRRL